jgi:hypothetical protein
MLKGRYKERAPGRIALEAGEWRVSIVSVYRGRAFAAIDRPVQSALHRVTETPLLLEMDRGEHRVG